MMRMTEEEDRNNNKTIVGYRVLGFIMMLGAIILPLFKTPSSPMSVTNALLAAIFLVLISIGMQLKRLD